MSDQSNYIDVNDYSVFTAVMKAEGGEDFTMDAEPEKPVEEVETKDDSDTPETVRFADEDDDDVDGGVGLNKAEDEDLVDEDGEDGEVEDGEDGEVEDGEDGGDSFGSGEYELDFETEVTLPNGEVMSIKQLRDGYLAGEEIATLKTEAETLKEQYTTQYSGLEHKLELSILECDRVIEDYEDYDWSEVAKESPEEYAENAQFLKRYKARKGELEAAYKEHKEGVTKQKDEAVRALAITCVQTLQKDIPEWSNDLYQELITHAVDEFGIDKDMILNLTDAGAFKLLHNSYKATTGRKSAAVKIKKATQTPKKVTHSKKAKIKKKPSVSDPRLNAFNKLVD